MTNCLQLPFKKLQTGGFEKSTIHRKEPLKLIKEKKYDDALAVMTHLLSVIEQTRGTDHPDYAKVLSGKATVRWVEDDNNQSALLYERALNILERALGPNHAQLAPTLSGWGKLYLDNGRSDLTEPFL